MSRDGRLGLLILAVGVAPALLKKSKPLAKYVGDQLIRAGEYLKLNTEEVEEPTPEAAGDGAAPEPVEPKPPVQTKAAPAAPKPKAPAKKKPPTAKPA